MVRFFSKPSTARKQPAAKTAADTPPPPGPPKPVTPARAAAAAAAEDAPEKKPAVRRRTTARPPRRDWAAEAAAAPIDEPAPPPTSLAASPADDGDPTSPAKRRRGTRGGRGRKKPGTNGTTDLVAVDAPPKPPAGPQTIEAVVAHQAAVLETFARDVSATLKSLQTTITSLQTKLDERSASSQSSHPRVGIFVDVPNLIYAAERRNVNIDFGRVLQYFTRDRQLVRASAYAPITDDPQAKLENQRFVHHFVAHPYRIITKPLKRFADGSMKANFDIELAIDILTMSDRLDVVVLMSGDGDFRRLVELIASRGVRVEVAAFGETASAEIKAVADLYIDFGAHLEDFKALK